MKRSIVIAIVASAFALPAQAGDFFTWPPTNNGIIHYGDEDDLSWMYVPPTAKPAFDTDRPGTPRPYVEFGDENNLTWLYQAPTAKFADPARQHPYVGFAPGSGSKSVPAGTVAGRKDN